MKGPMEFVVLKFKGNKFTGGIRPVLRKLVDDGTIEIVDVIFAMRDKEGNLSAMELSELDKENYEIWRDVVRESGRVLSDTDVEELAGAIEPNSSVAVMLFENSWARKLTEEIEKAKGEVVVDEVIPSSVLSRVADGALAR